MNGRHNNRDGVGARSAILTGLLDPVILAATFPARRAAKLDILRAVNTA